MSKKQTPINKEGGLLGDVNRWSKECRSLPFGTVRDECWMNHVLPLLDELNALSYNVLWDEVADEYVAVKGERGWVHPTIRLR